MAALLPPVMLPVAALLAVVLDWLRLRERQSSAQIVAKAFGMKLVATAIVWTAWALLWWVEQR